MSRPHRAGPHRTLVWFRGLLTFTVHARGVACSTIPAWHTKILKMVGWATRRVPERRARCVYSTLASAEMDLLRLEATMKWRNLLASICIFGCGTMLFAADKNPAPLSKTYDVPIEKVYAAVVQVASAEYNLKSAVKEGHTVSFFSGGQFSLVLSAICREAGTDKTSVSISIAQAVGNPQIFRVGKAKDKEALRFWTELDKAIQINQGLPPDSNESQSFRHNGRISASDRKVNA